MVGFNTDYVFPDNVHDFVANYLTQRFVRRQDASTAMELSFALDVNLIGYHCGVVLFTAQSTARMLALGPKNQRPWGLSKPICCAIPVRADFDGHWPDADMFVSTCCICENRMKVIKPEGVEEARKADMKNCFWSDFPTEPLSMCPLLTASEMDEIHKDNMPAKKSKRGGHHRHRKHGAKKNGKVKGEGSASDSNLMDVCNS